MLQTNIPAPSFSLPDQDGNIRRLEDFKGKKVVLYFYPKDNTSGCTKQACAFSELFPHFREKGAEIIGISKDSVASHKKFQEKIQPFVHPSRRHRKDRDSGLRRLEREDTLRQKIFRRSPHNIFD